MLHSCADSAYPVRASTLRNLGSVTLSDGYEAGGDPYFYFIGNNVHSVTAFVELYVGILKTQYSCRLYVSNGTFEVFTVALLRMQVLCDNGQLDQKDDGKTNFRNVGNYTPINTM